MFRYSKRYSISIVIIALAVITVGVIGSYEMISTKLNSTIQTTQLLPHADLQTDVITPTSLFSQTIEADHSSFQDLTFRLTVPRPTICTWRSCRVHSGTVKSNR